MNKQTRVWLVLTIALSLLALGSACSGGDKVGGPNTNAGSAGTEKHTGPTGTIAGVVSFNGTPAPAKKIDTTADPVCGQKNPNLMTDDTIVKDGKLANVFIYIKEGSVEGGKKFADYAWDTPATPVKLDQNGCHYAPHVLGVQVNQKIQITNSDQTQHNIHPTPKRNQEWNQTQAIGAPPIEKAFAQAEQMIPVKCNQHPWMKAYVGVMRHPFYAVSSENGAYEIKNVPPGTYTLIAWREGTTPEEKPMQVTVTANGTAKADFAFGTAASTSAPRSLQVMPAIEFPMIGKH